MEWDPKKSPILIREKGKTGQAYHACWDGKRWVIIRDDKPVEVAPVQWEQVAA